MRFLLSNMNDKVRAVHERVVCEFPVSVCYVGASVYVCDMKCCTAFLRVCMLVCTCDEDGKRAGMPIIARTR